METAPPPLDGTSPSSTTSRSNGTATAATFISHRAFLNPQIPKPARDALAARAAAASPAVPASEGGAPNGVTVDHTNGTAKAASTAIRNAEGSAYQSTMGIAVDPATGGPSIHDTNAGRSNSFTRRKRSEEEAVQLQERTPYGWPDAPQAHGNGMSPAPPTWSASREALDVSHGQDVFIHPSLASAPTSAAISASNHDHGLDDPLSAGFSGRGTFGEIEQPAASVRLKSNYVIGSPKSHKQSFSEEQWMKTGGLSNGHVEDERMANNVINERKEYDTRHPFALRGNGFQNGEYPLNPVIHDVKTRRTDHDGHTGLAKDISVAVPPARRTRNYVHLNALPLQSTRYYLSGLVQTGGDSPLPLIGSVILVLGLGGLWLGSTGVWIWRDGLGGGGAGAGGKAAVIIFAYLFGIVLSSMFVTAFRDPGKHPSPERPAIPNIYAAWIPGIIPRNLDVDPPSHRDVDGSMVPLTRDIRVRGVTVPVKYCETCKIYRPPRASHCRLVSLFARNVPLCQVCALTKWGSRYQCGNCVEGIDHHCTYLHTCVGRRNYTSFIAFLVSAVGSGLRWVSSSIWLT
jgi:hypothetical protein